MEQQPTPMTDGEGQEQQQQGTAFLNNNDLPLSILTACIIGP